LKEKTEVPKSLSFNEKKVIVSLCDHTGNWSRPYADDPAYEVVRIDRLDGQDVRLLPYIDRPVHGILAAPPCTHFSGSGACWWKAKGEKAVLEGMQVVDACLRAVAVYRPVWWALENPVGRLPKWLGPWSWAFHPYEYGGYMLPGEKSFEDRVFPEQDAYSKRTCIWGTAIKPIPKPVEPIWVTYTRSDGRTERDSPIHFCRGIKNRAQIRSVTPLGFARAFKEANP
jgi:hypothetical protein